MASADFTTEELESEIWSPIVDNPIYAVSNLGRGSVKGTRNANAKLKESDIPTIIRLMDAEVSLNAIGRLFGVSSYVIARIRDGLSWSHVEIKGKCRPNNCPTCGHVLG